AAAAAPREHARPLERRAAEQLVLGGRIDEGVEILYRVCEADGQRLPRSTRSALASFAWQRTKLRLRGMRFSPTDERDVDPAALRRLDSELTLAAGLGVVNPASGALWATRALLGALRSGEPGRVAQALAYEVGIRSALGWRGGAELIARARAIAAEVDRPDVSGSVSFGSGVVAYFDGRFDDALSDLVAAERDFTTARALPWQRTTARWFALLVLFHLGDLRRYSQRTCELLREAEERGDLHLQASVLGGPGQYHWLMRDRAEELRARLDETMAAWSQKRFQLQHHFELWANTLIDLYIDQPRAALARVERAWPEIERSPLRYTKMIYCTLLWLRAVARLACAEQLSASSERRRALREVGADVARMRRLAQPCFRAIELGLEAGIARVSGDDDRALVKLDEAIGCAERQGMTSAVMVFSWQRARVAGDEASRLVKARLDAQLHAQGVVNIERTLHSIAPGFRR
ncbi:MAG: hypothetical protein KC503_39965, partial [Myxococcales bacterium]|nr:hypothetical protein [Myxococcales bacterium]